MARGVLRKLHALQDFLPKSIGVTQLLVDLFDVLDVSGYYLETRKLGDEGIGMRWL